MMVGSYRDLLVWQKGMQLAEEIYKLMRLLPAEEKFALQDQMRRAVVSIPSNIAEGHGRNSAKSFRSFLLIAQGSKAELETQLLLCIRLGYLSETQTRSAFILCGEIGKMLYALSEKMKNRDK